MQFCFCLVGVSVIDMHKVHSNQLVFINKIKFDFNDVMSLKIVKIDYLPIDVVYI